MIYLTMRKQAVKHLLQNSDGGKIAQVSNWVYDLFDDQIVLEGGLERSVADTIVSSSQSARDNKLKKMFPGEWVWWDIQLSDKIQQIFCREMKP